MSQQPHFAIHGSRLLSSWMANQGVSLAISTYQIGKVFMIGLQSDSRLSVIERTFGRTMGMGVGPNQFWLSSLYQLWRFENFLNPGQVHQGFDANFVPVTGHTTGDLDVHDIHLDGDGEPIFVATRFNCLAKLSDRYSFKPIWTPPWIDRIAAEDRCHLNGFAVRDGQPAYASSISTSNIAEGWREHRLDGGVVVDCQSNEIVAGGLSMPHSPRWHNGKLWLLQAGTGEFGTVDLGTGRFEPVCFLPGFARGVSFAGDYAIIGISKPRENRTFGGMVINERLEREGISPQCAVCVVNLNTGDVEHQLTFEGLVQEIYDVQVLAGVTRPNMLGFKNDDIQFQIRPEA